MDPAESSRIRPTASLRRKKAVSRPPPRLRIREREDEGDDMPDVDAGTPQLPMYRNSPDTEANSASGSSSDDSERLEYRGLDDRSLLKSFRTHVVFKILHNQERGLLRCLNHTKKIHMWSLTTRQPNTRFMEYVRASSLYPLVACSYKSISTVEVSAFIERWHPETNTFHLPCGEMTITLDDVHCLLGLPVLGKSVRQQESSGSRKAPNLMVYSLGISYDEAWKELHVKGSISVKLDWLRQKFSGVVDTDSEQRIRCAARAYLLYILGCTIFADKSCTRVNVEYLSVLHDLEEVHTYAWGAGALAWLYRQLEVASRVDVAQMSGYLTLLQAWIYTHFPSFMPLLNRSFSHDDPIALRWLSRRDTQANIAHMQTIRNRLDNLKGSQILWDPYRDHREHHPFLDISFYMGTLKMFQVVEPYHPVRVLRQFGRKQYVPPIPFGAEHEKRGKTSNSYLIKYPYIDEQWTNWTDHVMSQDHRGDIAEFPSDCTDDYIPWFNRVSQRFLDAAPAEPRLDKHSPSVIYERNARTVSLIRSYQAHGEDAFRQRHGRFSAAIAKIEVVLTGCCTHPTDQDDEDTQEQASPDPSIGIRMGLSKSRRPPARKTRRK